MTQWGQIKNKTENFGGFMSKWEKIENYLNFKTQHYMMIYFSKCEKNHT